MQTMTSRERTLAAMTNRQPDRVPVAPDISNMIPCWLTGKPFWEIYYFNEPALWQAYIEAVQYFGIDGWFIDGSMRYQWPGERYEAIEDMRKMAERWIVRCRGHLDGRRYTRETTYYVADSPTPTAKPFVDLDRDWPLIETWFAPPVAYNPALLQYQRQTLDDLGAFGVSIGYPSLQAWLDLFQGGLMDRRAGRDCGSRRGRRFYPLYRRPVRPRHTGREYLRAGAGGRALRAVLNGTIPQMTLPCTQPSP